VSARVSKYVRDVRDVRDTFLLTNVLTYDSPLAPHSLAHSLVTHYLLHYF